MGSYSGKVVDIDTGEPIDGAVVSVIYSSTSSSPAGWLSKQIDVQETLTDANGEFVIPEVAVSGSKYSGHPRDDLSVLNQVIEHIHPELAE